MVSGMDCDCGREGNHSLACSQDASYIIQSTAGSWSYGLQDFSLIAASSVSAANQCPTPSAEFFASFSLHRLFFSQVVICPTFSIPNDICSTWKCIEYMHLYSSKPLKMFHLSSVCSPTVPLSLLICDRNSRMHVLLLWCCCGVAAESGAHQCCWLISHSFS